MNVRGVQFLVQDRTGPRIGSDRTGPARTGPRSVTLDEFDLRSGPGLDRTGGPNSSKVSFIFFSRPDMARLCHKARSPRAVLLATEKKNAREGQDPV